MLRNKSINCTRCVEEVAGIILFHDLKGAMRFSRSETYLGMFQLASVTTLMHQSQSCGSCGALKTCVFLHLVAKMSDWFLEQRINTKFCRLFVKSYHWR
jgi:hypothetical protein